MLVSADQFADLCRALEAAGWRNAYPLETPTITPQHAATYRHAYWECAVDVHELFPGFLADAQKVFEELWRSRSTVDVAGRELPTCGAPGNAAVAALHYLRESKNPHRVRQLSELGEVVRGSFGAASLADLSALATATGAADTLRPFLERVGAPLPPTGLSPADALHCWRLRSETPDLRVAWLMALRRSPARRWPRLPRRMFLLSEAELRAQSQSMPPGRLPVAMARFSRLRPGTSRPPPRSSPPSTGPAR